MNSTYEAELKVSIQNAAREAHKEGFIPTHVAMTSKTIKDMRHCLDLDYESPDVPRLKMEYFYRQPHQGPSDWYGRPSHGLSGMLEVVEDESLEEGEAKVCTRASAFVLGYVEGL